MNFDIISFFIGIHVSMIILLILAFIFGGGLKSNKKFDWFLMISFIVCWELAICVILIKKARVDKQIKNRTNEEIIESYKKEIRKADRRLKSKLEAFDKFEEYMLTDYGIKQTSKEKWIIAIRSWHTDKISDLIIKINELEENK